jgi:glutathione synthase/RimK-type ligase-like ATP-grasp enzyme
VLSRDGVCAALEGVDGMLLPRTIRTDRGSLGALAAGDITVQELLPGDAFPLIVRPLGSHAGTDLDKVSDAGELRRYLDRVGGAEFYLSRFIDYSGADGMFRKYRVVLIAGRPYICHFAISRHWMIHYLNAGMAESLEKRQQEADCMLHFDQEFAVRHRAALLDINRRIGLEYVGIDCAETADGQLLIFEIDNAMIVHGMDPVDMYAYKKPVMQKVFTAFRALLESVRGDTRAA